MPVTKQYILRVRETHLRMIMSMILTSRDAGLFQSGSVCLQIKSVCGVCITWNLYIVAASHSRFRFWTRLVCEGDIWMVNEPKTKRNCEQKGVELSESAPGGEMVDPSQIGLFLFGLFSSNVTAYKQCKLLAAVHVCFGTRTSDSWRSGGICRFVYHRSSAGYWPVLSSLCRLQLVLRFVEGFDSPWWLGHVFYLLVGTI